MSRLIPSLKFSDGNRTYFIYECAIVAFDATCCRRAMLNLQVARVVFTFGARERGLVTLNSGSALKAGLFSCPLPTTISIVFGRKNEVCTAEKKCLAFSARWFLNESISSPSSESRTALNLRRNASHSDLRFWQTAEKTKLKRKKKERFLYKLFPIVVNPTETSFCLGSLERKERTGNVAYC